MALTTSAAIMQAKKLPQTAFYNGLRHIADCFTLTRAQCDHGFVRLDPQPDDLLEFDARAAEYIKGYMGYLDDVICPISEDYKLSFPTCVRNLTHPENNEMAKQKRVEEITRDRERKANEAPASEKHDFRKDPPTERQMKFITAIAKGLEKPFPEVKNQRRSTRRD